MLKRKLFAGALYAKQLFNKYLFEKDTGDTEGGTGGGGVGGSYVTVDSPRLNAIYKRIYGQVEDLPKPVANKLKKVAQKRVNIANYDAKEALKPVLAKNGIKWTDRLSETLESVTADYRTAALHKQMAYVKHKQALEKAEALNAEKVAETQRLRALQQLELDRLNKIKQDEELWLILALLEGA